MGLLLLNVTHQQSECQIDYSHHTSKVSEEPHQTETIVNQELRTLNEVQYLVPRI